MKYKLVMVEWVDSAQPTSEWEFLSEVEFKRIVNCSSVGWLIEDGGRVMTLAANFGEMDGIKDSEQVCAVIRIPVKSIISVVELSPTTS